MGAIISLANTAQDLFDKVRNTVDFSAPLLLRIYLAPIFIMAGMNKLSNVKNVSDYFEYIGIPAPELMVYVAGITELVGGVCLIAGLAVRWVAVPLMFTMVVAAATAHWENGWHVLPETELTVPWEWRTDIIEEAVVRKERAKDILREHSNYRWITEHGSITILKNGIEWAATYFVMLLALMYLGAGRFLSLDYWINKKLRE